MGTDEKVPGIYVLASILDELDGRGLKRAAVSIGDVAVEVEYRERVDPPNPSLSVPSDDGDPETVDDDAELRRALGDLADVDPKFALEKINFALLPKPKPRGEPK